MRQIKRAAYLLVYWQLIIVMGLALILFFIKGLQNGLATLLGGLSYWVPNLLFVWRVFTRVSASAAKSIVVTFFAGEMMKLVLSAALFVTLVKLLPTLSPFYMLIGYITAIIAFWFICAAYLTRNPGVSP